MGIETAVVQYLDADGATVIASKTLPDAEAGVNQPANKFGVENIGSRALQNVQEVLQSAGGDGLSMSRVAQDTATVSRPYGAGTAGAPTGALSATGAGGVWGTTGQRGWKVTALSAIGETPGSKEVVVTVDDVTKKVTIAWTQTPNATGYKVYRTSTPGTYGATTLVATIGSGATISYVDDGTAATTGTPPAVNTTAGWTPTLVLSGSGAGGTWGATGVYYYTVVAFDSTGQPLAISLEVSVNVDDTTKTVTVSYVAVPSAASYGVYRTTVPGLYLTALVATLAGLSTVDSGAATGAGDVTLPPSYGVPPGSFGTGAISYGAVAVGRQIFFWFDRVIPVFTLESTDFRAVLVATKET